MDFAGVFSRTIEKMGAVGSEQQTAVHPPVPKTILDWTKLR